jgi:hypothetical protein
MTDGEFDFDIGGELKELADDFLQQSELPTGQVDRAFEAVSGKLGASAGSASVGASAGASTTKVALAIGGVVALSAVLAMWPGSGSTSGDGPAPSRVQVPAGDPVASADPAVAQVVTAPEREARAEPELAAEVEAEPEAMKEPAESEEPESTPDDGVAKAAVKRARAPKASPKEASTPKVSSVKDELLLLERARQAMRSGKAKRSLELLEEHERRFPAGRLARERDATRVSALCAAGKESRAKSAAASFVKQHGAQRASFDAKDPCRR